ncbi:7329_t:CDS:2 [Rhizophagus irregularis]|nr:7329_t:CDS:2 [Rhizophagus irregularis]
MSTVPVVGDRKILDIENVELYKQVDNALSALLYEFAKDIPLSLTYPGVVDEPLDHHQACSVYQILKLGISIGDSALGQSPIELCSRSELMIHPEVGEVGDLTRQYINNSGKKKYLRLPTDVEMENMGSIEELITWLKATDLGLGDAEYKILRNFDNGILPHFVWLSEKEFLELDQSLNRDSVKKLCNAFEAIRANSLEEFYLGRMKITSTLKKSIIRWMENNDSKQPKNDKL